MSLCIYHEDNDHSFPVFNDPVTHGVWLYLGCLKRQLFTQSALMVGFLSFVLLSCLFQTVIRFTMDSLIAANTKFCFDLFQKISTDDCRKNIFFCPLSLSAALGMVRLGARSGSARQIDQVRTALRVRAQSRPDPWQA